MGIKKKIITLWQDMSRKGKAFTFTTDYSAVAGTSEFDFVLMSNPIGSNTLVRFQEFIFTLGSNSLNQSVFRFYRNPTVSNNGTPITVNKVLPSSVITSEILVYQNPTISDRGALIQMFSTDFRSFERKQELSRYFISGAKLLITVQGSQNNIDHNINALWAEEKI